MLGHNISTQHENKVVLAFKTAPGLIMNSILLLEKKQKYVAKSPKKLPRLEFLVVFLSAVVQKGKYFGTACT